MTHISIKIAKICYTGDTDKSPADKSPTDKSPAQKSPADKSPADKSSDGQKPHV